MDQSLNSPRNAGQINPQLQVRLLGWLSGVPSGSGKYLLIESWEILAGTLVACLRLKIAFQSVVARNPNQLIDLTAQWMEHMRPRRDVPFELLTQLAELQKIGFYVLQQEATALEHHESFKTILPQGADALTTARVMRALPRSLDPMRSPHGAVTCYPAPPGFLGSQHEQSESNIARVLS